MGRFQPPPPKSGSPPIAVKPGRNNSLVAGRACLYFQFVSRIRSALNSITKVTFTRNEKVLSIHLVVWQFWGRAAEASWTEKSRALFLIAWKP
jgi:hypothetical protein